MGWDDTEKPVAELAKRLAAKHNGMDAEAPVMVYPPTAYPTPSGIVHSIPAYATQPLWVSYITVARMALETKAEESLDWIARGVSDAEEA